jgi:hypothetical protein
LSGFENRDEIMTANSITGANRNTFLAAVKNVVQRRKVQGTPSYASGKFQLEWGVPQADADEKE